MEILLDTNFIITSLKKKIQLVDEVKEVFGVAKIVVPLQVVTEIEKLRDSKKSKVVDRGWAGVALLLVDKMKKVDLDGREVDAGIVRYVKDKNIVVATLDRELKKKIKLKNPEVKFLTIREKRFLVQ